MINVMILGFAILMMMRFIATVQAARVLKGALAG